ncbi:MAG TPA: T3SS effector HopA1 family protein [Baekduia sp.]|nr:T3SS effector HopA1 family protein [Baekduia sp.]
MRALATPAHATTATPPEEAAALTAGADAATSGKLDAVAPDATAAATTTAQLAEALALGAGADADRLYAEWYARPLRPFAVPASCPPDLTEALRAADAGSGLWEDGWRVERAGTRGHAVVRRGAEVRLLERIDYTPLARPGLLPRRGDEVAVTGRRDRVDGDGWWRTAGRSWSWAAPPSGLVRLYFNMDLAGLPALIARLTGLLAGEPEPWLVKCATDPATHARADATIAYLTPESATRWAGALVACAHGARNTVPPLTLAVAPGLSAAFDPGPSESFGTHRCGLIAEAPATVEAIATRFDRDDIDVLRPWARRDDPLLPWER